MQTHGLDEFYFGGVIWKRNKKGVYFSPEEEGFGAYFHKFLYGFAYGVEPEPGFKVAHIDGDWDNNEPENLECRLGDPAYVKWHTAMWAARDEGAVDLRQHRIRKFEDAIEDEEEAAYRRGVAVVDYRRHQMDLLRRREPTVLVRRLPFRVLQIADFLEEARRWDDISSLVQPWYRLPVRDLAAK